MKQDDFTLVGIRPDLLVKNSQAAVKKRRLPLFSFFVLAIILTGCLCCELFIPKDPTYMDLNHLLKAPCREFLFGTDSLGRDIFSMIWYGGRISLLIGILSTLISGTIAVIYGAASGLAPAWLDDLMTRFIELFLSVPGLLLVIFLQAAMGEATVFTISVVIGATSWPSIAKVVRTEVRKLRNSEYVLAAKTMGGGFFHILFFHLLPNFFSAILFMIVMNIRSAIVSESTLSFMGIGLPLEIVSWGSMLSLSEKALLTGSWWVLLIPGLFLAATLVCVTEIGNFLKQSLGQRESYL